MYFYNTFVIHNCIIKIVRKQLSLWKGIHYIYLFFVSGENVITCSITVLQLWLDDTNFFWTEESISSWNSKDHSQVDRNICRNRSPSLIFIQTEIQLYECKLGKQTQSGSTQNNKVIQNLTRFFHYLLSSNKRHIH